MLNDEKGLIIRKTKICLLAVALDGLAASIWLLLIPKEPENAVILGYSLRRLALLIPLLLPAALAFFFLVKINRQKDWLNKYFYKKSKAKFASWLVVGGAFLTFIIWSLILLLPILLLFINRYLDMGVYVRLLPHMILYFLVGLQALLYVLLVLYPQKRKQEHENAEKREKFPSGAFLVAFTVILCVLVLIETTGLGKDPGRVSIIVLGVPILEGQIWYVIGLLVLGAISAFSWLSIPKIERLNMRKHKDLMIAVLIWLVAVTLWMSLPLPKHNYFAPQVRAPNFELYPFSDAEQYAFNSLYVYYGTLKDFVVSKPLYVSILTLLHAIVGLDYGRIVFLQTLVVAFFPVVLYLIGREFHCRFGGIALALLAIFREVSAIMATNLANVSNTKLLLSDMPAALLASLLALTLIRWFKIKEKKVSGHEFLTGGLVGALILTRIQTMVLLPFVMLLAVIRYWRKIKPILFSLLLIIVAVGLVIVPILVRNHSITGVFWIDNPSSSRSLYTFFMDVGDFEINIPETESSQEDLDRNISVIKTVFIKGFGDVLNFTADNFLRNEMSSMLVFPVRAGNGIQFSDYLTMKEPFWQEVYIQPNILNLLVFLINVGLIAMGFAKVYTRHPWPLLVLLSLHVVYSLSSAVVRLSGWRFIQPVDWIFTMLYAFGLVEMINWLMQRFLGWNLAAKSPWLLTESRQAPEKLLTWPQYALSGLLFLSIGAFIPARENLLPVSAPQATSGQVCQKINDALLGSEFAYLSDDFMEFCQAKETLSMTGIGIYPRYFKEEEGYYQRENDPWFGEQDYAHLTFRSIGEVNRKVYIKINEPSIRFANGTQVLFVGRDISKFEAQFVLIDDAEPELLISEDVISGEDVLTVAP